MLELKYLIALNDALRGDGDKKLPLLVQDAEAGIESCLAKPHPYGFIVFELGEIYPNMRLRLHVWPAGFVSGQSRDFLVHDHIYDMVSYVLAGSLIQEEFRVSSPLPGEAEVARYHGSYNSGGSVIERTPEHYSLAMVRRIEISAGRTYTLRAGQLHSISVDPRFLTATVLATEYKSTRTRPIIMGPAKSATSLRFERAPLGFSKKRELISGLIDAMKAQRA